MSIARSSFSSAPSQCIRLRGVRQNNLKGFDLDLPLGRYIVVTGLSGAGKSSLVFDTLHAEGQRRYVETFSAYTRQFLDLLDKPKVDSIENIRPSIAIEQTNTVKTSRSTVGTMTEHTDFFKVWFSHVSACFDPATGEKIDDDNPQTIWDKTQAIQSGRTIVVAFKIAKPANLSWPEILQNLRVAGATDPAISFTPVLVPMARGILATSTARIAPGVTAAQVREAWEAAYADEPFVHVLPAGASAEEVYAVDPDGVFFSNGPGDPATAEHAVSVMRAVLERGTPLFGICFGNQILGRALGLGTYKLPFGHRGINQPVREESTGRVLVTAHNHGFAVDAPVGKDLQTPFGVARVAYTCLNDGVVEGLECGDVPAFSVQFHPEAAAGPHDAGYLFDRFADNVMGSLPQPTGKKSPKSNDHG